MRATILVPPPLDGALAAERIFGCNYGIYSQPNVFLLTVAAVLERAGFAVALEDFTADGRARSDLVSFLSTDRSDLYLFYTVFLSRKTDLAARELAREQRPGARFLFLGTEPTANPEAFVAADTAVVRGEPELTVEEAAPRLARGEDLSPVPGIAWERDGVLVQNPARPVIEDLDSLPFPDRSLLERDRYHNPKLSRLPFTAVLTSRGCAYQCYYCVPNSLDFAREIEHKRASEAGRKPPVRMRSASNVLAELRQIRDQGYRSFSILDDQFLWDEKRTLEIMAGLKGLGLEWSCLARADRLTSEGVVKAMAEAGCAYVDIGVESFDQGILDYIRKDLKVETVYRAVDNLNRHGIEPELNILLGSCPLETEETIRKTVDEVMRLDVDYALFSVCTPFPHTAFNEIARREGWMIEPEYRPIDPIKESFISYPHLPKARLEKLIRQAYFRFYFRPSYILRRLRRLTGPRDLWNKARAAASILRG